MADTQQEKQQQFEQMLVALASEDASIREHAEAAYRSTFQAQPLWLLQALIEVGCSNNSSNASAAASALELLRKNFSELYPIMLTLSTEQMDRFKQSLLNRVGDGNAPMAVRKAAAAAIANLAAKLTANDGAGWPN